MAYRHIIKAESKDKQLNEKLDRLDKFFYETLGLIPINIADMASMSPEDAMKAAKMMNGIKETSNDVMEVYIADHEMMNQLDTKLDGLESLLKDIKNQLDSIEKKIK